MRVLVAEVLASAVLVAEHAFALLLARPDMVLTPHLGGSTIGAQRRAGLEAAPMVIEAPGRSRG